jgi:uncharacterized protein YbjT (DUF2867 family)
LLGSAPRAQPKAVAVPESPILVCGATGELGGRIVRRLRHVGVPVRALVRPASSAEPLRQLGVELAVGDFRDRVSLDRAVAGARAVVSTVTVIARLFAGEKGTNFHDVDLVGHRDLIAATEAAGVERFLFVSAMSIRHAESANTPLGKGKVATERGLSSSAVREVVLRPDLFQEIWLSPEAQFDWPNRKVIIFGKGETPSRYIATDDVAEAAAKLVLADDPPRLVEFGGPDALTRKQAVAVFEEALGQPIRVRHVPRTALRVGSVALRHFQPAMASVMGGALALDLHPATCSEEPLRQLGITPRPVEAYATQVTTAP